nr:ribonuclease H-like domain-containing protein [Tanacetum cinerariifolium]
MNGDALALIALVNGGAEAAIPPKTTEQKIARRNELKAKFHGIKDAKTLWEAIKTSFRGNKESKEIHKTILKQQYKNFVASRSKGLDKTYDKFQKLISQLEIHGEVILQKDANLKFLRSLPPAWNTHTLIIRNKSDLDTLSQAFALTYADDVMFSFFANQSNSLQLDNKDLEQIDIDDLKEIDLKWQVAMLTMRVKRFIKKIGRNLNFNGKEIVGFDKTKGNKNGESTRRFVPVETPAKSLVVTNGMGYDWSYQDEERPTDFALMAFSSSGSSSSDTEVIDNSVTELKNQLEKSLKEKYDLKLKLEKFEASFKNLTNLINSQISPKDKTGLGYDSQLNERDLNNKSDVFESTSDSCVNESEEDNNQANGRYKAVEGYHAVPPSYTGNFMPPRLDMSFVGLDDSDFKSGKATGQREVKPVWNNAQRVNHQNFSNNLTHPHTRRNFVPTAVITNSGKVPVNTAKQSSPRAATSISTARYIITATTRPTVNGAKPSLNVFHKSHSPVRRTFNQITAPKINDLKETINTDKVNNVTTAGSRDFDSGCSKNMTGNKSFYTDYQEINGGFVAFGGSPIGGKISRKGKIRIGKLDFKDVYFVKELKFNLFSVSQMCDKKNSVLFTETKCLVLSPEFKLLDENQVLLKVPKQNNMYSFD